MSLTKCTSIVQRMLQADQDALLTRLENYQAVGMSPKQAQLEAAKETLRRLEGEGIQQSARELIETPQFKAWFGDSKVVDDDGKPLVVYHGTVKDFDSFKTDSQLGAHFGTTAQANQFLGLSKNGGDRINPVLLSIKNPLRLEDRGDFFDQSVLPQLLELGIKPKDGRGYSSVPQTPELQKVIKEHGYDGIVYLNRREGDHDPFGPDGIDGDELDQMSDAEVLDFFGGAVKDSYIAFDPEQIKSVFNNGDFDGANPSISKSARSPLGFYSALAEGIESIATKQQPAGGWLAQIKGLVNKGAVKQDEVEWSGLTDWLTLQEGKITKQQVLDYLEQNGVQVQETVLGAPEKSFDIYRKERGGRRGAYIMSYGTMEDAEAYVDDRDPDEGEFMIEELADEDNPTATKYEQYTLPGGKNYREVLLTLPAPEFKPAPFVPTKFPDGKTLYKEVEQFIQETAQREYEERGDRFATKPELEGILDDPFAHTDMFSQEIEDKFGLPYRTYAVRHAERSIDASAVIDRERVRHDDMQRAESIKAGKYQSSHWDAPNVLAHLRVNDRTDADGAKVLFVEELQSDWGQQGKKDGFAKTYTPGPEWTATYRKENDAWTVIAPDGLQSSFLANGISNADEAISKAAKDLTKFGVPAAPFVANTQGWLNLALKRAIIMAVEGGYKKIAFVNGEQNAERYSLEKHADQIVLDDTAGGRNTLIMRKNGSNVHVVHDVTADKLPDYVGQDLSERLLAAQLDDYGRKSLSGIELKSGGEGMKTFYNTIVPNATKALLKKLGGGQMENVHFSSAEVTQVGRSFQVEIDGEVRKFSSYQNAVEYLNKFGGGLSQQPGFSITPEMIEKVGAGVPLFSKRDVEVEMDGRNTAVAKVGKKTVGRAHAWLDSNDDFVIMNTEVLDGYRRRGIATKMYNAIEASTGKQLKPAISLSDDAFEFWKSFRPEAVAQDLRHWKDQLIGAKVVKNGQLGKIIKASGGSATMEYDVAQPGGTQSTLLRRNLNEALVAAGGKAIDFEAALQKSKRGSPEIQDTPEFKTWSQGLDLVEAGEEYAGGPAVFTVYHGTTHSDITQFERVGQSEGFLGKGPYFTTDPEDASENYAGIGPDLTGRIEREKENIYDNDDPQSQADLLRDYFETEPGELAFYIKANQPGFDAESWQDDSDAIGLLWERFAEPAASLAATRAIKGDTDGLMMKAYVRMSNPADTTGNSPDLTYELTQDDDGNVTDETGTAVDWVLAAREVGERYNIGNSIEEHIDDVLSEGGDVNMKTVFDSVRKRLNEAYDDQGEMLSAGAIFTEIAEEAGYDGVIMDAGLHFGPRKGFGGVAIKGMKGVKTNTLHMVPFSATQVKSATGNSGAFDPENPDIRYSRRAAYGVDQPDVLIGSPLGAAQNHPDYAAAKSGDVPAAMRLSAALVNQELIAKIKDLIGDAKPVVVPVVAIEASGRNKIPRAAAEVLAAKLGLKAATSIGQRNSPKRTGMDGVDRLFASPVFDGDVVAGQDYLLLDDTITQGGTFAALASHIQAAGGRVLGSVALTGKQYSATLKPSAASLQKLRDKFSDIEPEFQAITGYGFDALTESEARYIANYKPADTLRVRILAEGRRAGRSADTPTLGAISKSYRPEASRFDDTVYKLQNKMIDTKRVIESITAAVGQIADDLNVYLQEELFHGRAAKRVADFGKEELKPLMEQIGRDGYTIADVEEYLQARHAPEANQVIAQRNPNDPGLQDGGSGMANAAAAAYMASLSADDAQKLAGIAAQVDAIIRQTRQLYVSYSLESQDTVDAWEQMFQNYIPLQREDKEGRMGIGQGFSVKGKETKGRTGSTRKVVDVLANIALQREKLIVRGEKNRVATALVGLATANPDPDLWSVGPPPSTRVYDPKTNTVVDRVDPMYKSRDEVLVAKIADANGVIKEVAVVFNQEDPRALRMVTALKNLDAANLEGLLGVSAKITRYFSAVNTQYNPVFGVVNLVRDVQGAMINLSETPLAGQRLEIARNTMSALAGIYADMRAERNGTVGASPWAQLFEEFELEGGQTGFRDLFKTSADRAEALQKILTPDAWMNSRLGKIFTANGKLKVPMSEARKGAGWIFDWLSDYNGAMENAVRLSAYKAGIDQGMSKQQAASLAKNLTVNFNRKGQAGQHAGALYAFFNAAMQGTARLGQTLFTMQPGKPKTIRLSSTGKKVVYGGILLGVTQAMLLAAAGFGDDDPPEFLRERALIIPVGGKNYVSIPMPLGFHVIPGIGRHAAEFALSGFEKPQKRIVAMVGMFMDAFNPIGNAGLSMQTVMPTALDPLAALLENKDWTGKPIARTSSNPAIPGHTQFKDTATAPAKWLAEAINWVTGGNEYVAGVISPTPDQIDYLFGQVTGGVGRELSKVEQTAKAVVTGEELPTFKVPLAGRFFGNADSQASQASAFYDNVNKLNELETEVKGMRKDGKAAEAAALIRSRPDAYLIARANVAERQVQRLRREKRELLKKGAERSVIKAKEAQITETMKRLNAAMAQ